jgi:hypothetical protein
LLIIYFAYFSHPHTASVANSIAILSWKADFAHGKIIIAIDTACHASGQNVFVVAFSIATNLAISNPKFRVNFHNCNMIHSHAFQAITLTHGIILAAAVNALLDSIAHCARYTHLDNVALFDTTAHSHLPSIHPVARRAIWSMERSVFHRSVIVL